MEPAESHYTTGGHLLQLFATQDKLYDKESRGISQPEECLLPVVDIVQWLSAEIRAALGGKHIVRDGKADDLDGLQFGKPHNMILDLLGDQLFFHIIYHYMVDSNRVLVIISDSWD